LQINPEIRLKESKLATRRDNIEGTNKNFAKLNRYPIK
jgi:hypothetical protein